MDTRNYYAPDIDIYSLARALADWYAQQGYQSQAFQSGDSAVTIQARKESTLRTLTGMSSALTVALTFNGESIAAQIGGAKWVEKAAVGGVGLVLAAPVFLVTAGVGAWQQNQLQNQTWQFIDNYMHSNSAYANSGPQPMTPSAPMPMPGPQPTPTVPAFGQQNQPMAAASQQRSPAGSPPPVNMAGSAAGAANNCSQCGQPLRTGAKFCDNCGAPATNNCRSCGRPLRPGARFCDECGTPVG